jgi:hypothetical protein
MRKRGDGNEMRVRDKVGVVCLGLCRRNVYQGIGKQAFELFSQGLRSQAVLTQLVNVGAANVIVH